MRLNNKTQSPPAPSVNLVVEDKEQSTQVFATKRLIRGKEHKEYRVIVKNGPRYTIDTSERLGNFIRRSEDNKLVGLLKNGEMKRSRVDQIFFLSKLDLMPNIRTTNDQESSLNDLDEASSSEQERISPVYSYSTISSSPLPSTVYISSSPHPSTSSSSRGGSI